MIHWMYIEDALNRENAQRYIKLYHVFKSGKKVPVIENSVIESGTFLLMDRGALDPFAGGLEDWQIHCRPGESERVFNFIENMVKGVDEMLEGCE